MMLVLFKNSSGESTKIERILKKSGISYKSVSRSVVTPELISKEGVFVGIENIAGYAKRLSSTNNHTCKK